MASFRSTRTRAFLTHLRESQCYEVFINERLSMAGQGMGSFDAFETKVGCYGLLMCCKSPELIET